MGVRRRLPHSFLCLMKTDFSEQVEKLRKEITAAIKAVLEKYGKTEMEFPDTVDAVYVIWFGEDLHLVVENKHSHDLYEIDGPFELGARCINWLDEILRTTVQLLSDSNTKTK